MNRKRRKKALSNKLQSNEFDKLYKETLKQVQKSNQRLKSIERKIKEPTQAVKRLQNRLSHSKVNLWTIKKRVNLPKEITKTQLLAVHKATRQFLNSLTSTKAGLKQVREHVKKGIRTLLEDEEREISDQIVDDYSDIFLNSDYQYFADKIGDSELLVIINTSQIQNDDLENFINRLRMYIDDSSDDYLREKAERLYNEFVRG